MTILNEPFTVVSKRSGHKRICLTIEMSDGKKQPFYQSTGTNGYSKEGQWIPFEGVLNGWFAKTYYHKVPPIGSEHEKISHWLADQIILSKSEIFAEHETEINQKLLLLERND